MTLFDGFADGFASPDEERRFECVACGSRSAEPVIDCPACAELVVRVVEPAAPTPGEVEPPEGARSGR